MWCGPTELYAASYYSPRQQRQQQQQQQQPTTCLYSIAGAQQAGVGFELRAE